MMTSRRCHFVGGLSIEKAESYYSLLYFVNFVWSGGAQILKKLKQAVTFQGRSQGPQLLNDLAQNF